MYDPRYDFSDNSVISITLILETWLKVMAHILPKCMLWVNVSQIWPSKENIIMPLTSDPGRPD